MKAIVTIPPFPRDGSVKSLGRGVVDWIEANLVQPDGESAGEPYLLTGEQVNFIYWWYAVDERGKFTYRRGVFRRSKGHGKSPFSGALCLAELCGPVRFNHWGEDGHPVGRSHPAPWVIVAGVSETQTENTLAAARAMAVWLSTDNGGPLDIGKTRILHTGVADGKLHSITASSASQEGARPTFAIADEPHHWTKSNGGHALARVIRRNLAKVGGRLLETTNAHAPTGGGDEASVAEKSYLAFLVQREGKSPKKEILYDCREVSPLTLEELSDEPTLREALRLAYGDSTWVDLDPLVGEIYDPDSDVQEMRRFYLNQIVAASDAWLKPELLIEADNIAELARDETIVLGFDGSLTDDATALVGVRCSDGQPFLLGIWEKPPGPAGDHWRIEKGLVRGTVDQTFERYDVIAFFADVENWETDIDDWRAEHGERLLVKATTKHAIGWDMRGHLADNTYATEALHRAFSEASIRLDEGAEHHEALKRHILNARRRPNRWGTSFGKESRESPKKVDALSALLLARMAWARVVAENVLTKRRPKAGLLYGF